MSDIVRVVSGKKSLVRLSSNQRLLIETAHGIIEVRGDIDRSRGKSIRLEVILPEDLRFRKGVQEETELFMKFLDVIEGTPIPNFQILTVHYATNGYFLREPESLLVGV